MDHFASMENAQQKFWLKQTWRCANDESGANSDRHRCGWDEEDLDAPPKEEIEDKEWKEFQKHYHVTLKSHDRRSDALFWRFCWEARKWTTTFANIERIKDLHHTQLAPERKRLKIAETNRDRDSYQRWPLGCQECLPVLACPACRLA